MKKLIKSGVSLIIIFAVALAAHEAYFKKPDLKIAGQPIVIAEGVSNEEIAKILKDAGVISSAALFSVLSKATGSFKDFHPGTFVFKEGMSVRDAIKVLTFDGREEVSVVIPEGFSLRQIAARLVAAGVIKSEDEFFSVTGHPGEKTSPSLALKKNFPFLNDVPADSSFEGYLFPDTYRFYAEDNAEAIVSRMLENYGKKIASLAPMPVREDVVIASLVEKEVKKPSDMAKVADIIKRRLGLGMRLGFDSTVNYVTGKNDSSVTYADTAVDSLWNTYKYPGLPKTPIASPGLEALRAALSPTPNVYLYFLTTKDGAVVYSKTLDEHNAAKEKYLK
jgi:UPF0755 protein